MNKGHAEDDRTSSSYPASEIRYRRNANQLTSELLRSTLTWCHSLSSKRTPFLLSLSVSGRGMEVSKGEPEPSCTASDTRPSLSDNRR